MKPTSSAAPSSGARPLSPPPHAVARHAPRAQHPHQSARRIEYDPNRSAFIALLKHPAAGAAASAPAPLSYIICPRGITVGSELQARAPPLIVRVPPLLN